MNSTDNIPAISSFYLKPIDRSSPKFKGYYLTSTASIHVENTPGVPTSVHQHIKIIANHLLASENPQLVISIHGYANKASDVKDRTNKIYDYAQKSEVCKHNTVFVGYRWPSENVEKDDIEPCQLEYTSFGNKVKYAFASLPTLMLGIFNSSLVLGITAILLLISESVAAINLPITLLLIFSISATISYGLNKFGDAEGFIPVFPNGVILISAALLLSTVYKLHFPTLVVANIIVLLLSVIFALICGVVVTLIGLKLSTYQSDRYRANNYGVVDIVSFIKELDKAIFDQAKPQNITDTELLCIRGIDNEKINKHRIKLSFINHSLGCEVVTQSIRILSDVFYQETNAPISKHQNNLPQREIGYAFNLGRLVLVAPDIPIESILSGRANFLRASLRRCEEAYVFSNEADLALRLASTAANYASFPSKTRFRGYKLGNITIKSSDDLYLDKNLKDESYGIINYNNNQSLQHYLEVRASKLERKTLAKITEFKLSKIRLSLEVIRQFAQEEISCVNPEEKPLADYFTYFDCTDYADIKARPRIEKAGEEQLNKKYSEGLLSFAASKPVLNFWFDYILIGLAYFAKLPREINVHGGYFDGEFSQRLMYDLAFLGFKGMLEKSYPTSLEKGLSQECQTKGIKVLLASKDLPNQAPIK